MRSDIDIQKIILSMGESRFINLDVSLREVVESSAVSIVNSAANLEPWELICYTWVTYIRRHPFEELTQPGSGPGLANPQEMGPEQRQPR
jgi:hypothetical protein